ncbi:hypothetical protein F4777DRAFT_559233 [Nemania sp. FL0916]|nr:hypothetical protein F4777DRAFT_559233 [Nemania sp. FL0916]
MPSIRFLTASQLLRIHYTHIFPLRLTAGTGKATPTRGPSNPLLQPSYLESALASPVNHNHYAGTSSLSRLAALLAEKIILDHPFYDGNKRTGLFSMDMFLRLNQGRGFSPRHGTSNRGSEPLSGATPESSSATFKMEPLEETAQVDEDLQSLSLSAQELALADAMVDVATRRMDVDQLSSFVSDTAPVGQQDGTSTSDV